MGQTVISNCHLTQTPIVFKIMLMENKQECDSTKMAHSSVNMEPLNATKCNKNIIKCLLTASTGIRTRVCATIHLTAAIFEMATELDPGIIIDGPFLRFSIGITRMVNKSGNIASRTCVQHALTVHGHVVIILLFFASY